MMPAAGSRSSVRMYTPARKSASLRLAFSAVVERLSGLPRSQLRTRNENSHALAMNRNDAVELALAKYQQVHVRVRHDGGRAWSSIEQRHLAEVLTGPEHGDALLAVAAPHAGLAVEDEEELTARPALLAQRLSRGHPYF